MELEAPAELAREMLLLPLKNRLRAAWTVGSRLAFSCLAFLLGLEMDPSGSAFTRRAWSSSIFKVEQLVRSELL